MLRGTMPDSRKRVSVATVAFLALAAPALAAGAAADPPDPLAAEIDRWLEQVQSHPDTDPLWADLKQSSLPALERAREELREGRRLLALERFASTRADLAAALHFGEHSAEERKDMAAFEAVWKRAGGEMQTDLGTPSPARFDGMPALVRALSEAALPQVRAYYDASLDYGHSMTAGAGLFYLSHAQAQRDLLALYRSLSTPSQRKAAPPLRSIRPEIDALEDEILAEYKPPASIERHSEFIAVNGTLKEARELDAAGLRYGALLRYLQAAQQFGPLRSGPPPIATGDLAGRMRDLASRLSAGGIDHGIGELFLETARSEAARVTPGSTSIPATDLVNDVLPRYFAALEPARPQPARPEPQVTVTLVRWPYT